MNIVVCLKQVPGTTEVRLDPKTNTLIRQGVQGIINPLDTYALEEGVRLKERYGGEVTVISMGPPQVEATLREAISLGADRAILLSDAAFAGADTLATSLTLAAAVKKIEKYDLVICGRQTIDGDTGQVGPELAEMLDVAFIAYVSKTEDAAGGKLRVQRMIEEGRETIETALPAVITVTKEINVPRLPSLRGIAKSKSIAIPVWKAAELGIDPDTVGLAGSATRVIKVFTPQRVSKGEVLTGDPASQVDSLIGKLKSGGLVR